MSMRCKTLQSILVILRTGAFAALFLFLLAGQVLAQNRNNTLALRQLSESLQDLSARISPSVVQIFGTGFGLENDVDHKGASVLSKQRSTGSGVMVSDDGYIMTNA